MLRIIFRLRWLVIVFGTAIWAGAQWLFHPDKLWAVWNYVSDDPLGFVFNLLGLFFLIELSFVMMRLLYAEYHTRHLVYMRVTLPRSDSKIDQEKRTEKDFKEKMAVAEQFFRAMYEISELNLSNILKTAIFQNDKISFELFVNNNELSFYVITDKYYQNIVERQITTFYPDAEVTIEKPYEIRPKGYSFNGFYFYLQQKEWFPIKTYKNIENDPLNDLANAFSKLNPDDKAAIQVIINPRPKGWQKEAEKFGEEMFKRKASGFFDKIPIFGWIWSIFATIIFGPDTMGGLNTSNAPGADSGDRYIRMLQTREEIAKRIGEKSTQVGFDTTIRVVASSPQNSRVENILNNLVASFGVFRDDAANFFENRRHLPLNLINAPMILHAFTNRLSWYFFQKRPSLLVPEELATMYHFPDSRYNPIPIIKWLQYKVLPPPINLPPEGILLGRNRYRAITTDVRMKKYDRSRHQYIIGKSGSGKSALLSYMARQDVINGEGLCVVDPHGDLIEDILAYVPKERAKDVIVFDPADTERPIGLNLLEAHTPEEKDRASLDAMNIFLKLFGNEIFGPRIQHYFRNGCLTLMDDEEEGATLIDLPRLFVDDAFQKYKVSKCKNTVVRQFWENEIAKTGAREKEEMIPYFSSKFGPFITNTTMRNIIGQAHSGFNIRKIMDEGKILLVNLSKGKIGDINAQLLGLIFVNKISMAAMSRADIPEKQRRDFYLYVDEFQNFATDAFADILSEARKYHLSLIMAHQYIAQLQTTQNYEKQSKLRDAVFGNVGTMMSFKVGAEDAEYLAKEYAPLLSEQDIIGVANYKAYVKLNIDNTTSRPFSMETIWDESGRSDRVAEIVKKYSQMKYGRKRAFVDQEIEERLGIAG